MNSCTRRDRQPDAARSARRAPSPGSTGSARRAARRARSRASLHDVAPPARRAGAGAARRRSAARSAARSPASKRALTVFAGRARCRRAAAGVRGRRCPSSARSRRAGTPRRSTSCSASQSRRRPCSLAKLGRLDQQPLPVGRRADDEPQASGDPATAPASRRVSAGESLARRRRQRAASRRRRRRRAIGAARVLEDLDRGRRPPRRARASARRSGQAQRTAEQALAPRAGVSSRRRAGSAREVEVVEVRARAPARWRSSRSLSPRPATSCSALREQQVSARARARPPRGVERQLSQRVPSAASRPARSTRTSPPPRLRTSSVEAVGHARLRARRTALSSRAVLAAVAAMTGSGRCAKRSSPRRPASSSVHEEPVGAGRGTSR